MNENNSTDPLTKILETIEAQADTLRELAKTLKEHAEDLTAVKKDLTSLKDENKSFRQEVDEIKKQTASSTCLGASSFVERVCESVERGKDLPPDPIVGEKVSPDLTYIPAPSNEARILAPAAHSTQIPPERTTHPHKNRGGLENRQGLGNFVRSPSSPVEIPPYAAYDWHRPVVLPLEYDGKLPWSHYETHFNAVSRMNGWSYEVKALYLTAYLRGTALAYYQTLDTHAREDFERVSNAFRLRFSAENERSVAHIRLRARVQRSGESFSEYATDLQRLTFLTFEDCPESARDRIALEQFLDGILDLDVQERVRDSAPTTLQQALQTAIRIEANHRATRAARRHIRVATTHIGNSQRRPSRRAPDPESSTARDVPEAITSSGNYSELA